MGLHISFYYSFVGRIRLHNLESICFLENGDLLHHVLDTLLLEDIRGLHHSIFVCATGNLGLAIQGCVLFIKQPMPPLLAPATAM